MVAPPVKSCCHDPDRNWPASSIDCSQGLGSSARFMIPLQVNENWQPERRFEP